MTGCRTGCRCTQATVALPCDDHERVITECSRCRPAVAATVLDWTCTTHRTAAEWDAAGIAHAIAA